jgi:hypothetical protein
VQYSSDQVASFTGHQRGQAGHELVVERKESQWKHMFSYYLQGIPPFINFIRFIRSRRMRRTRHVACMGKMTNACKILVGKPEDLGVDEKIILEWILRNRVGNCRLNACGA